MRKIQAIGAVPLKNKSEHIFRKKVLAAQLALSISSLPMMSGYTFAQTVPPNVASSGSTCTSPSSTCLDLYQGTISAIQQYNYQPYSNSQKSQWKIQSFTGGVLQASPMVIVTPSGQGTPTNEVIGSTMVYNCPANTNPNSGTITVTATVSDTTEISSSTEVMNSNSGFNSNSASVNISYSSPPSPYGSASVGASYTYEWGTSYENSTTTGGGTTVNNATGSEYVFNVNYSVAPGQYQYVQITDSVVKYTGANWTSNVTLTGDISNNIYTQYFINTVPPTSANFKIPQGVDANRYANVWVAPKSWNSANGDQMASPNGAYAYLPNFNNYLISIYWTGSDKTNWGYAQGTSQYGNTGFTYSLNPIAGNTPNLVGVTNTTPGNTFWAANPGIQYLALLDEGWLTAYDANWNVIWTSAWYWEPTPLYNPSQAMNVTPAQVLPNGQAFTATGTYNATTYNSTATVGVSTPVAMTQDMINSYCSIYYSDSKHDKQSQLASNSENKGYGFVSVQNIQNQNSRGRAEQIPAPRREAIQNNPNIQNNRVLQNGPLQNGPQDRDNGAGANLRDGAVAGGVVGGAVGASSPKSKAKEKRKVERLKSPLTLKSDQFFASNLPGVKISKVVVHSENLNSYVGFVSDKGDGVMLTDTKQVKIPVGETRKFSVQGK